MNTRERRIEELRAARARIDIQLRRIHATHIPAGVRLYLPTSEDDLTPAEIRDRAERHRIAALNQWGDDPVKQQRRLDAVNADAAINITAARQRRYGPAA